MTIIISTISGANFWAIFAFWPVQAQQLYGPDSIRVSLDLLPYGYGIISGMVFFNWAMSILGGANRELLALATAIMTAGTGAMACLTPSTPALAKGISFLGAFGSGGLLSAPGIMLTIISPDELIATISAVLVSTKYIGASIGYAVYFNVLERSLSELLPKNVGIAVLGAGLPVTELAGFLKALLTPNTTALSTYPSPIVQVAEQAVEVSYVASFKLVYLISIAFGGTAFICCLFLGNIKRFMTDRVAVDIH